MTTLAEISAKHFFVETSQNFSLTSPGDVLIVYASISAAPLPFLHTPPTPEDVVEIIVELSDGVSTIFLERFFLKPGTSKDWSLAEGKPLIPGGIWPSGSVLNAEAIVGGLEIGKITARVDFEPQA